VAFALASIISLVFFALAAQKKKIPSAKKIFSASGIGFAFAMSNFFNTSLAGMLDSAVFFPLLNIGTIIFSLILGIGLYKEKFTKKDLLTLIIAITAIILITR
jgi:glucose uptake protein GlcU